MQIVNKERSEAQLLYAMERRLFDDHDHPERSTRHREYFDKRGLDVGKFYRRIKKVHEPIATYFCKSCWGWTQRADSDIANSILLHFTEMGEACLPVHDSFIVAKKHKIVLANKMKSVYADFTLKNYGFAADISINGDV